MSTWVVKPGEYLTQIAAKAGVRVEHIWSDPRNASLRDKGRTPDQLVAGDVLHVPPPPTKRLHITPGGFNPYVARVPMVKVPLVLANEEGPLANEPFEIEGLPQPLSGTTDAQGKASFEVPVRLREVTIVLPARSMRFQLSVGALDPISEPTGVFARLANLGFAQPTGGGDPSEADVRAAVSDFQRAKGIEATGEIDDATRAEIESAHGT